ncbi:MAG: hypothetical protein ACOCWR_08800 [Oceanidesulfovibrio sp.]
MDQALAQTQSVGEYVAHAPGCADQWQLPDMGARESLPAVSGLTQNFSGGALNRSLCLVGVVKPGGVYLDQTVLAVAEAPAGPVVQVLQRPVIPGYIPIAECWPATVGYDDINGDSVPDIAMMLECQDRNTEIYARPNAVYLSEGRGDNVYWRQDARLNADLSEFETYDSLRVAARATLSKAPTTPGAIETGPAGQSVTLRGEVRDCDENGDAIACTIVFEDGPIRRISMTADPGLVQGRTGAPDPRALAGREVLVEGTVDAHGELVRVNSMRLAE